MVYDDWSSCFEDLLNKDRSVTIHQRKLQQLELEICKRKIGVAPIIMNKIFSFVKSNAYNSRSVVDLSRVNAHSTQ